MPEVQEIVIRITGDTTGISAKLNSLKSQLSTMGQNVSASNAKLVQSTQAMEKHVSASYNQMTRMVHMFQSALFYMAGHMVFRALTQMFDSIVNKGIQFNATMEETNVALKVMLGSAREAEKLLNKVWEIAAHTPFEFAPLAEVTKQLIAFGYASQEIPNLLMHISDAVSALGGGMEKTQRIITNLGQVMALGIINAREIRDLSTSGINMYKALSEYLGKSTAEIAEMVTAKMIDAKTAVAAFIDYTEKRFGGMSEIMAMKFSGLGATIRDFFSRATGEITSGLYQIEQEIMRAVLPALSQVINYLMLNKQAIYKWTREVYAFWIRVYESVRIVAIGFKDILSPVLIATWKILLEVINTVTRFIIENEKFVINIVKITIALKAYLLIVHAIPAAIIAWKAAMTTLAYAYASYIIMTRTATGASVGFLGSLNALRIAILGSLPVFMQLGIVVAGIAAGMSLLSSPQVAVSMEKSAWLRQKKEEIQEFTKQLEDLGFTFTEINQAIEELYQKEQTYWNVTRDSVMQQILNIRMKTAEQKMAALEQQILIEEEVANIQEANEKINKLKEEQLKMLVKYNEDAKKLMKELSDEQFRLTHSQRDVELRELRQWYDENYNIAKNSRILLEQLNIVYNLKAKEIQKKYLDEKKKAQEEYTKFEVESWNRMYEKNTAEMKKYYEGRKSYQDFIDEYTLTERQKEFKRLSEFLNDLYAKNAISWDEVIKGIEMGMVAYDSKTATANYTSLLQMQKDMEEFLKDFDMEKFKLNAQKVIDLSVEAAKFISTLTINLDPAVAEKLKEINKTFNEVTIGNLTEMIRSFTDFSDIINKSNLISVDPKKIQKVLDNLVLTIKEFVFLAQFAFYNFDSVLDSVKEINELFKDTAITEFMSTLKTFMEFNEFIDKLEVKAVNAKKMWEVFDLLVQTIKDFLFVSKFAFSNLSEATLKELKELNEFFKDSAVNEFMSTLKNMFDLINFINELEYKPVSEAKLDSMLTYLTEFMVLLAGRTKEWVEALKKDNLLESMRELNETFKDTTLNEFIGTIKSVFELVNLFEDSPDYNASTAVNNIVDFLINLESFVIALDNALISIGRERLGDIATRSRETFGYLNKLFKDISLDEFMKMVKSLDEVLERFTPKFDEQGKQVADLLSDVANVASRIKWFFTQLDTLAKELEKMFSGEEGKYLEAVSGRVKSAFGRLNNAFKDITLTDFTNFMSMLKNFEESVMKDKNGKLMTSIDIDKVKEAIIGMLKSLEELSKELDQIMNKEIKADKTTWIETLKEKLENTVGKVDEIMKYALDKMMNIRNSWNLITGTVTDIKGVYLSTILDCITGLSEMLDSPLWKGIIDKVENVYIKVGNKLFSIQGDFENMRVTVESTLQKLTKNLDQSFTNLINTISNAQSGISDKLTDLGIAVEESKAVEKLSGLGKSLDGIVITMDNMVSKIGTWIVSFTKFCFTIAYLATLAMRAVEQFNLEMERMLKMAGAFKAFVMEIKPLMEDMIKLFGTWGELMTLYGGWIENLTKSNQSRGGNWSENFGGDPWDYPPQRDGSTTVGSGGWYDTGGTYHPESNGSPVVIQGDLVIQGVQNPQQLMDELKRLGNMRGAVNANYNY